MREVIRKDSHDLQGHSIVLVYESDTDEHGERVTKHILSVWVESMRIDIAFSKNISAKQAWPLFQDINFMEVHVESQPTIDIKEEV